MFLALYTSYQYLPVRVVAVVVVADVLVAITFASVVVVVGGGGDGGDGAADAVVLQLRLASDFICSVVKRSRSRA